MSDSAVYVCENCARLGTIDDFADECKPGWTHGRLIRVTAVTPAALEAIADAE